MGLLKISDEYKQTADRVLKESKLVSVLQKYGTVEFEGAYAGNVMLDGDIDMRVVREVAYTIDDLFVIMKDIYTTCHDEFRSFYLKTDWADPKVGHEFPYGHYLGFKSVINGERWKWDVWFVSEAENQRDRGVISIAREKLTEEQRKTILEFKKYRKDNSFKVSGQEIYQAVLEQGLTQPEEFFQKFYNTPV